MSDIFGHGNRNCFRFFGAISFGIQIHDITVCQDEEPAVRILQEHIIKFGYKFLQVIVREENFRLMVILQLPDSFHWIFVDDVFSHHPVKEHMNISDIVIGSDKAVPAETSFFSLSWVVRQ